ncbi:hypothetical protein Tco_1411819 [Tanacetum coccineum]
MPILVPAYVTMKIYFNTSWDRNRGHAVYSPLYALSLEWAFATKDIQEAPVASISHGAQKAGESWLSHPKQTMLKNKNKAKAAGTYVYHDSLKKLKNFADYQTVHIVNIEFPQTPCSSANRPAAEYGYTNLFRTLT